MGSVGKGSDTNTVNSTQPSPLVVVRENARQFNEALQEGRRRKAAVIEFEGVDGKVYKRYWNGAAYVDRAVDLQSWGFTNTGVSGTYSTKFKVPKEWQ